MSLEAQLAAALNMSARRRAISDAGEPPTESLVLRLCEQARSRMRVDVQEASGYAAAACDIARMLRAPKPMAEALRMKGHVNYLRGRHREAARTYEKAVTIIESLGAQVDVGRTMSSALQTLIYLGRHEQALTWSHRARQIFEAEGDQLRLAPLDGNVANVFHRQERFDEALCLYQSALARLEELGDEESSAITLRNMAVSYMSVHDFSSALRANERALAFYRQRGLILLEAEVNDNIAYLHSLKGNYTKAIALYQNANLEERGSSYHVAVSKLDQSDLYLELNLFTEAAQLAHQAADRFRPRADLCRFCRQSRPRNRCVPAGYKQVAGAASTNLADQRSFFSNHGDNSVMVAAPGEELITPYPGGRYAAGWGTSFGAPLVSGTVALMLQLRPQLNWEKAHAALAEASPVAGNLGSGRLDVYRAVRKASEF